MEEGLTRRTVEQPEFRQALLEFARRRFDGPWSLGLARMTVVLAYQAVLGDEWVRANIMLSGPWELEVIDIQDGLHKTLREEWATSEGEEQG